MFTAVTRHAPAGGDDARLRLGYLRAAHDDQRLLPGIVITARSDASSLAVAKGVARLMQKPLDIPVLLETMRELLAEPLAKRLSRLAGRATANADDFMNQTNAFSLADSRDDNA